MSDEVIPILSEAEALVMELVTEQNRIHDNDPAPIKYRAAFGVVAKMIVYLKRRGLYKHCCPHTHVRLRDGAWRCIACNSPNVRGSATPVSSLSTDTDRKVRE